LTIVTPDFTPEPLAEPKVGESVRRMLEQRGINLITEAKVLSLDPEAKKLILDHGINVAGDLFLGIPSQWGPSVLRDTGFVEKGGWIKVDPHTLQTGLINVFAIGDVTALRLPVIQNWAPKAGIYAHYQAEVVARNIASLLQGKKPIHRYKGKGV
jgi:sulfide:quinone oxidoreductase